MAPQQTIHCVINFGLARWCPLLYRDDCAATLKRSGTGLHEPRLEQFLLFIVLLPGKREAPRPIEVDEREKSIFFGSFTLVPASWHCPSRALLVYASSTSTLSPQKFS